ncbi:peptidase S10, serine carboxypeptidase [Scenedesmus sp. NREL 46B-D3]|nr:peptidase S10, serine carboxypeptidase [Scenedesmus sp. NREL 46B-D3]
MLVALLAHTAHAIAPFSSWQQHGAIKARTSYTPEAEADRVDDLPGSPNGLDFNMFSGYVTVDSAAGRALFYIFAEAREAPSEAPLLLWLNGGPGCSSLGGGFMSELGPFYPSRSGRKLQTNPYAWNDMANVIWLESPAFVGFSYSNTSADAIVGDGRTAADARLFLLGFLKRFPQYTHSDFYISGESYAGHYVPNLAWEIVLGNKRAQEADTGAESGSASAAGAAAEAGSAAAAAAAAAGVSPGKGFINLKGFLVGNAWTDPAIDNEGALDFWYSHAMIGEESYRALKQNCDFSVIGPLMRGSQALTMPGTHTKHDQPQQQQPPLAGKGMDELSRKDDKDATCAKWLDIAMAEQGNINIYEIYADVCSKDNSGSFSAGSRQQQQQGGKYYGALLGHASPLETVGGPDSGDGGADDGAQPRRPRYDPCVDGEVETYLNLPEVQAALHANQTRKLPWRWSDCSGMVSYSREDLLSSMLPTYKNLLGTGLKVWVFSGDVDGIVPVLGSRRWVASLGLPTLKPWRPWHSSSGQVGGWRVDYQNLTFATVRNAGHMVPYVQPERAYYLLGRFLFEDKPEPTASRWQRNQRQRQQ